MSLLLCNSK